MRIDGLALQGVDMDIQEIAVSFASLPPYRYSFEGRVFRTLVTLRFDSVNIGDDFMMLLTAASPSVQNIDVVDRTDLTDASAFAMARNWASLRNVRLCETRITDAGAMDIASNCQNNHSINLYGERPGLLSESTITAFVMNCPLVEHMIFDGVNFLPPSVFHLVAQHCPRLRTFSVGDVDDADDACIMALVDVCPQLETIGLPYSDCCR